MEVGDNKEINLPDYLKSKISINNLCNIPKISCKKVDEVNIPVLKSLLTNRTLTPWDVEAMICFFKSFFGNVPETDNIPDLYSNPSTLIPSLINSSKKIDTGSVGQVDISRLISDNLNVVIKHNYRKQKQETLYNLEEYYKSLLMNRMRYYVPNFMCTFGAFYCNSIDNKCSSKDNSAIHIIYEYINGKTLNSEMEEKRFDWFINIFLQLLLALEVAGRHCLFIHDDFHQENVMISRNPVKYSVLLDDLKYNVETSDGYPVIIDYGTSYVYDGDIQVSMLNQDNKIHKYMDRLHEEKFIRDISTFMSIAETMFSTDEDKKENKNLQNYLRDILKNQNTSPLDVFNLILQNNRYKAMNNTITVSKRDDVLYIPTYTNEKYISSESKVYNLLFNIPQEMEQIDRLKDDNISKCYRMIEEKDYYIQYLYFRELSNMYKGFGEKIYDYNSSLISKNVNEYILKYEQIPAITERDVSIYRNILQFTMNPFLDYKNDMPLPEWITISFKKFEEFKRTKYIPLIDILEQVYLIRHFKLETEYSEFLTPFLSSPQYAGYIANKETIEKIVRWHKLLKSLLVKIIK